MASPGNNISLIEMADKDKYRKSEYVSDNPLNAFAQGAYSFPRDWWIAIHWVNGMNGLYGKKLQKEAQQIGRYLEGMIRSLTAAAPITFKICYITMRYIMANQLTGYVPLDDVLKRIDKRDFLYGSTNAVAGMSGRFSGKIFTNYASTGGRFGKLPRKSKLKKGYNVSTFLLASTGSLLHLAAKTRGANVTVVDMVVAVMIGRTQSRSPLGNSLWRDLYRETRNSGLEFDANEQRAFYDMFSSFKKFLDEKK